LITSFDSDVKDPRAAHFPSLVSLAIGSSVMLSPNPDAGLLRPHGRISRTRFPLEDLLHFIHSLPNKLEELKVDLKVDLLHEADTLDLSTLEAYLDLQELQVQRLDAEYMPLEPPPHRPRGTFVVKFAPPHTPPTQSLWLMTDRSMRLRAVPLGWQSITMMPQYENVSLEELRVEDYEDHADAVEEARAVA
jgi:hypothetical protein